jgi:hypothetical protein
LAVTGRLHTGRKKTEPRMKGNDAVVLILEPARGDEQLCRILSESNLKS